MNLYLVLFSLKHIALLLAFSFVVFKSLSTDEKHDLDLSTFPSSLKEVYSKSTEAHQLDSIYRQTHASLNEQERCFHRMYYAKLCSKIGLQKKAIDSLNKINLSIVNRSNKLKGHYYSTLAGIAINSEEPEKSKQLYLKSLHHFIISDDDQLTQAQYINLGRCYTVLQNTDSALQCYNLAGDLGELSATNILYLDLNRALTMAQLGETEYAKRYFIKALNSLSNSDIQTKVRTLGNIADLYFEQDSIEFAEQYYSQARDLATSHHLKADLFRLNRSLSQLYEHKSDYELAYHHYTFSDSIRQSFDLSEVDKSLDKVASQNVNSRTQKTQTSKTNFFWVLGVIVLVGFLTLSILSLRKQNHARKKKPANAIVIDEKAKDIIKGLELLMFEKELYKQPNLTIQGLAKKLKTNRTYLSEVINAHYKKSFSKWINEVRVTEAKKILASQASQKYSIQGISSMVGFSSISSFNSNFKALTGLTPSNFRDRY